MHYHPDFDARIRDLSYLGANDTEIAKLFGVSLATLRNWYDKYPSFAAAWDEGAKFASAKVAGALFKRAVGYDTIRWKETKDGIMREQVHVEPNVPACVFWLTNKNPDQWKNKSGPDVGELPKGSTDALSEIEAARRIAFVLAKAMYPDNREEKVIEHVEPKQPEAE